MLPIMVTPVIVKPGLSPMDGGGRKIVLHTTEVGTEWRWITGADGGQTQVPGLIQRCRNRDLSAFREIEQGVLATWRRGGGYPTQYLITPPLRSAIQCVPNDTGGYALVDVSGGVRTNRAGERVIQIEMVGHAAQLRDEYDSDDWVWLGQFLRQLCVAEGVPFVFPLPFLATPQEAYGVNKPGRLSGAAFKEISGIIGHQHVPENEHWDPGFVNVELMMRDALPNPVPPTPTPTPDPTPTPNPGGTTMWRYVTVPGTNARFLGLFDSEGFCGLLLWIQDPETDARWKNRNPTTLSMDQVRSMFVSKLVQGDGAYAWAAANFGGVIDTTERGPKGDAGMQGPPGPPSTVPGPKGDKGDKGDPGAGLTDAQVRKIIADSISNG